ncbi:MAG TPA: hypothetical protein VF103_04760, partial [Polyangiaceae bacterium]
LARKLGAEAVVWVTGAERGSLLWVFDARAGNVTTRLLSESPPFDSAAAASVALTVKTVLRSSVVAPPAERFGAPRPPPPEARVFLLELGTGLNWIDDETLQPRFELAMTTWIAARRRLGLSMALSSALAVRIEDARYRGDYDETAAGGKARFRMLHGPTFWSSLALGGAVHWAKLEGTLAESSLHTSVSRLNGSLDFETSINARLGSGIYLGASLGVSYFPTYQRYLVEGVPVFSPWPVVPSLRVHLGVEPF